MRIIKRFLSIFFALAMISGLFFVMPLGTKADTAEVAADETLLAEGASAVDETHLYEAIFGMAKYVVNHTSPNSSGNYLIRKETTSSNTKDINTIAYYPGTNTLSLFFERYVDLEYIVSASMSFKLDNVLQCNVDASFSTANASAWANARSTPIQPCTYVMEETAIDFDIYSLNNISEEDGQQLCNATFMQALVQWNAFLKSTSKNEVLNFGFCSLCSHNWEPDVISQEPTCIANGLKTHTCSRCSYLETVEILPTGDHKWGAWIETKPASPLEKGEEERTCSVCGEKETREVSADDGLFNDVKDPSAWYYKTVYLIASTYNVNGKPLMSGYANGSGNFGPADPLTRQDFAVILYRLADEPEVPPIGNPFVDTDPAGYYYQSVLWAKAKSVIAGYNDGRFGVGDKITREQVATILYRFAKDYLGIKTSTALAEGDLSKFNDGNAVSSWAEEALTWATGAGIITGKSNGTLVDARGNAARAEIGAMVLRFLTYIQTEKRIFSGTGNMETPLFTLDDELMIVNFTNDAKGSFKVDLYDETGTLCASLVNVTTFADSYKGQNVCPAKVGTRYYLKIESEANWTVTFDKVPENGTANNAGSGDWISPWFTLDEGPLAVNLTHIGDHYLFAVELYDETGKKCATLAHDFDDYQGTSFFCGKAGTKYCIKVIAAGSWTISFDKIPENGTSNIAGSGDWVSPWFTLKNGKVDVNVTNDGKYNFRVDLYDETGRLCVCLGSTSTGPYEKTTTYNASAKKKYCIKVESGGNWTVDFGLGDSLTTN